MQYARGRRHTSRLRRIFLVFYCFDPTLVKFSLSRSYFFSPNGFDLGRVDCTCCKKIQHIPYTVHSVISMIIFLQIMKSHYVMGVPTEITHQAAHPAVNPRRDPPPPRGNLSPLPYQSCPLTTITNSRIQTWGIALYLPRPLRQRRRITSHQGNRQGPSPCARTAVVLL